MKKKKQHKYSAAEKRAYWVGYGIRLSEMRAPGGESMGDNFLSSGRVSIVKSANSGYEQATKDRHSDYKNNRFNPSYRRK